MSNIRAPDQLYMITLYIKIDMEAVLTVNGGGTDSFQQRTRTDSMCDPIVMTAPFEPKISDTKYVRCRSLVDSH